MNTRRSEMIEKKCVICNKLFQDRYIRKLCSKECRRINHNKWSGRWKRANSEKVTRPCRDLCHCGKSKLKQSKQCGSHARPYRVKRKELYEMANVITKTGILPISLREIRIVHGHKAIHLLEINLARKWRDSS